MNTSRANTKNASAKPLPLNDTLRDLALLRASDIDLASLLPQQRAESDQTSGRQDKADLGLTLDRSYEFVEHGKAVLRIRNRGLVEKEGEQVDRVRGEMENALKGLPNAQRPDASR